MPLVRLDVLVPPEERLLTLTRALRVQVFGAPTALEPGCALIELGADHIAAEALHTKAKAPDATSISGQKAAGIRPCILAPSHRHDLERALRVLAGLLADADETIV